MLFSKKYIIGHILVIMIACACFALSAWQFARLQERKDLNSRISASMKNDPSILSSVASTDFSYDQVKDIEYRPVTVTGTYFSSGEVLIAGRSRKEDPGYNVATPFVSTGSEDDTVVYVNRGWIPQQLGDDILEGKSRTLIAPQGGYNQPRTIEGLVRVNEEKRILGSNNQVKKSRLVSSRFSSTLFIDVSGYKKNQIYPLYIHLQSETREEKVAEATLHELTYPILLDDPELTERNHLSYAVQWILFGCVAIGSWSVLCFKANSRGKKKRVTL